MENINIDKTKMYLLNNESGRIYKTSDYNAFSRLVGNRSVTDPRWMSIAKSIKKVGYIQSPIVVNEKFEIIDGQGRFKALKYLNMPVEFVISPGAGINQCISMNISGKSWKDTDFIDSYVELGNSNYKLLKFLMDKYKINYNIAGTALFLVSRLQSSIIRDGKLVISYEELKTADDRLELVSDLQKSFDTQSFKVQPQVLIQALIYTISLDNLDLKRLRKILKEDIRLPKAHSYRVEDIIEAIDSSYNNNLRYENKIPILFKYQQLMKNHLARGINNTNKSSKVPEVA